MQNSSYNSMCTNCKKFNSSCPGTTCKLWTGCTNREVPQRTFPEGLGVPLSDFFSHAETSKPNKGVTETATKAPKIGGNGKDQIVIPTDGYLVVLNRIL